MLNVNYVEIYKFFIFIKTYLFITKILILNLISYNNNIVEY